MSVNHSNSSANVSINNFLVDVTKINKEDSVLTKGTKFLSRSVVHLTQSFWHSIDCALKVIQSIGYLLIAPFNITNDAVSKSWYCAKRSLNCFFRVFTANPLTNLFYGYQSEFLLYYMAMKPYSQTREKVQPEVLPDAPSDLVRSEEPSLHSKNNARVIPDRPNMASVFSDIQKNRALGPKSGIPKKSESDGGLRELLARRRKSMFSDEDDQSNLRSRPKVHPFAKALKDGLGTLQTRTSRPLASVSPSSSSGQGTASKAFALPTKDQLTTLRKGLRLASERELKQVDTKKTTHLQELLGVLKVQAKVLPNALSESVRDEEPNQLSKSDARVVPGRPNISSVFSDIQKSGAQGPKSGIPKKSESDGGLRALLARRRKSMFSDEDDQSDLSSRPKVHPFAKALKDGLGTLQSRTSRPSASPSSSSGQGTASKAFALPTKDQLTTLRKGLRPASERKLKSLGTKETTRLQNPFDVFNSNKALKMLEDVKAIQAEKSQNSQFNRSASLDSWSDGDE